MEPSTPQQRRYFFKLATELGYNPELLKERAKEKYQVESFMDLNKYQLSVLIDKLVKKLEEETNGL